MSYQTIYTSPMMGPPQSLYPPQQQAYIQQPYIQQETIIQQQGYVQQPYIQQPYMQQPYVQQEIIVQQQPQQGLNLVEDLLLAAAIF
jgi:hypothetical protein